MGEIISLIQYFHIFISENDPYVAGISSLFFICGIIIFLL